MHYYVLRSIVYVLVFLLYFHSWISSYRSPFSLYLFLARSLGVFLMLLFIALEAVWDLRGVRNVFRVEKRCVHGCLSHSSVISFSEDGVHIARRRYPLSTPSLNVRPVSFTSLFFLLAELRRYFLKYMPLYYFYSISSFGVSLLQLRSTI